VKPGVSKNKKPKKNRNKKTKNPKKTQEKPTQQNRKKKLDEQEEVEVGFFHSFFSNDDIKQRATKRSENCILIINSKLSSFLWRFKLFLFANLFAFLFHVFFWILLNFVLFWLSAGCVYVLFAPAVIKYAQ